MTMPTPITPAFAAQQAVLLEHEGPDDETAEETLDRLYDLRPPTSAEILLHMEQAIETWLRLTPKEAKPDLT